MENKITVTRKTTESSIKVVIEKGERHVLKLR